VDSVHLLTIRKPCNATLPWTVIYTASGQTGVGYAPNFPAETGQRCGGVGVAWRPVRHPRDATIDRTGLANLPENLLAVLAVQQLLPSFGLLPPL